MPFVLALDQGTTSSRAIVFDERGSNVGKAFATVEFEQSSCTLELLGRERAD